MVALIFRPPVIGVGPLLPAIQADLGMSYTAAGVLSMTPLLCMGLFSSASIPLANRFSPVKILGVCLAVIAISSGLRVLLSEVALLMAVTIVLGIALALGNAVLPLSTSLWYRGSPMSGTGSYVTGLGIGGAVAGAIAAPLLMWTNSWRTALLVLAMLALPALLMYFILERNQAIDPLSHHGEPPVYSKSSNALPAWWLSAAFACNCALAYGMSAWLPAMYVDRGWSVVASGVLVGVYNAAALAGGMIAVVAEPRFPRASRAIACVGMALCPGLMLGAVGAAGLWVCVMGICNGVTFTILMAQPRSLARTRREFNLINGRMLAVGYGVAALVPILLGWLRDSSGDFTSGLIILVAGATLMGVVFAKLWGMRPHAL